VYVGRLLRDLAREFHKLARGRTDEHSKLRDRLATTVAATLVIDAIGSVLMYALEHGEDHSQIDSKFESFFWVTTQLLTVSSQMQNPVTTGGRIVDMVLQLWAITVVAAVVGSFAAFLQRR
jgi:hypothetical protein